VPPESAAFRRGCRHCPALLWSAGPAASASCPASNPPLNPSSGNRPHRPRPCPEPESRTVRSASAKGRHLHSAASRRGGRHGLAACRRSHRADR